MHAGIPLHCLSCIKLTHILQRQAASEPGKACTACCDHRQHRPQGSCMRRCMAEDVRMRLVEASS